MHCSAEAIKHVLPMLLSPTRPRADRRPREGGAPPPGDIKDEEEEEEDDEDDDDEEEEEARDAFDDDPLRYGECGAPVAGSVA
jgi:hypothetical protein